MSVIAPESESCDNQERKCTFHCPQCAKKFSSQGSLFNNIQSAHICVRFSCDQCINQFSSKGMIVILIPIYTFTAMFGGHDETQLLFMSDGIHENRENLIKIIELLGLPMDINGFEIRVSADLKLSSILTGLHGNNARHCCIYCEVLFNDKVEDNIFTHNPIRD